MKRKSECVVEIITESSVVTTRRTTSIIDDGALIEIEEGVTKKRRPGRPRGLKVGDYQLELQKRARMCKVNEESAQIGRQLFILIFKLLLKYPETPFMYGDYPFLYKGGGALVSAQWLNKHANAYDYIFKPNLSVFKEKIKRKSVTFNDLNIVWLDRITKDEAIKMFPDEPRFCNRFGNGKCTRTIFTNDILNYMLSVENTGFYPLDTSFYSEFLEKAAKLAPVYPASDYARTIQRSVRKLAYDLQMNPFKYSLLGVEMYFGRHKAKTTKKEEDEESLAL